MMKLEDQPLPYIKHMIDCYLDPVESMTAPLFPTMLANLQDDDIRKLKVKLSQGLKDHKDDRRQELYKSWRQCLKAQRPDVATTIMENLM